MSSEDMIREAREDVYDDDPLEGFVPPDRDFDSEPDGSEQATGEFSDEAGTGAEVADRELLSQRATGPVEDLSSTAELPAGPIDHPATSDQTWASEALRSPVAMTPETAGPEAPPTRSRLGGIVRAVLLIAVLVGGWLIVRSFFGAGTDVQTLQPGDCFLDFEGSEVSSVETTDCTEPHQFEVFGNVVLPDGPYPGQTQVDQEGYDACLELFPEYVGLDYGSSVWYVTTLLPLEGSWPDDRTVNCLLVQPEPDDPTVPATVTGSARDSGV